MNSKDDMLRALFMQPSIKAAMQVRIGAEVYKIAGTGVYKGPAIGNELSMPSDKPFPIQGLKMLGLTDVNRVKPEVMLDSMQVDLTDVQSSFRNVAFLTVSQPPDGLEAGMWMMDKVVDEANTYRYRRTLKVAVGEDTFADFGVVLFGLPEFVLDFLDDRGQELKGFKPTLMKTRLVNPLPVLMLTGEEGLLYMPLCLWGVAPPYNLVVQMPDGSIVEGDGYAPDIKKWKKLRLKTRSKKTMVKGLGSPLEMGKKKEVKEEAVEQAVEATVEGTVHSVEQPTPLDITTAIPEPETVEEAGVVVAAEPAVITDEQPAAEGQEQKAAAAKRQRPNPQKAVDPKLAKDMEELTKRLNAPIDGLTPDQFKEANAQIKRARDLVMVAVRYIANMSEAMTKTADGALEMYVAMKALLK